MKKVFKHILVVVLATMSLASLSQRVVDLIPDNVKATGNPIKVTSSGGSSLNRDMHHNSDKTIEEAKRDFLSQLEGSSNSLNKEEVARFIENKGQWKENILYRTELINGYIYMEKDGLTYHFYDGNAIYEAHHENDNSMVVKQHAFKASFKGYNASSEIKAAKNFKQHEQSYFIGDKRITDVKYFHEIKYENIYDNIDVVYHSYVDHLKYDINVKPGGDVANIVIEYEGADEVSVLDNGSLLIQNSIGGIGEYAPYSYQIINGEKVEVSSSFKVVNNTVSFEFPKGYNQAHELIIDPTLLASTYTGSTAENWGFTAAHGPNGEMVVAGITNDVGYPTTFGAFQSSFSGGTGNAFGSIPNGSDITMSVFSADGTSLLVSTYIGGSDDETPHSLAVNQNNGNIYLMGKTRSFDFPTTIGAFDNFHNFGGEDIFVLAINNSFNSLIGSTYIGGSGSDGVNVDAAYNGGVSTKFSYGDSHRGQILLDNTGAPVVVTSTNSTDFPVTGNAQNITNNGGLDIVLFNLNPTLTTLTYSTYFGGSANDAGYGLTLDPNNNVYFVGATESTNFPTSSGVIDQTYNGNVDGFVTSFNSMGQLLWSTYLGTPNQDGAFYVDVDAFNSVYVYGLSWNGQYPVTSGVYTNANSSQFIHSMNQTLTSTNFSTVFGSGSVNPNINPTGFLVDDCGHIITAGWGRDFNADPGNTGGMTVTSNAFKTSTDGRDFHFQVLSPNATTLRYATMFGEDGVTDHVDGGSSTFDDKGVIYQAICASCQGSSGFPTTPGAYASTNGAAAISQCNNAVIKFDLDVSSPTAEAFPTAGSGCVGVPIQFSNNSTNAQSFTWDFGDGSPTSNAVAPIHTYAASGIYNVSLVAFNSATCTPTDTSFITINIGIQPNVTITPSPASGEVCLGQTATLTASGATTYEWLGFTNQISNVLSVTPSLTSTFFVVGSNGSCNDTTSITVIVLDDCDGDGVTDIDEINGPDGDPNTPDGTDPDNPCNFNVSQITLVATSTGDCDGDGVTNADEINGTDGNPNTTGDNTDHNDPCDYNDGEQTIAVTAGWNALDCDGDGITNGTEVGNGDDPLNPCDPEQQPGYTGYDATNDLWSAADCDNDGDLNGLEDLNGSDPYCDQSTIANPAGVCCDTTNAAGDCDGDGVTNGQETTDGTSPNDPCDLIYTNATVVAVDLGDCDGDGVTNADEINGTDGNPLTPADNTDPNDPCDLNIADQTLAPSAAWNVADCDNDGVTNSQEEVDGTDINDPCSLVYTNATVVATDGGDCDGDGVTNADEVNGTDGDPSTPGDNTDPLNPCDFNNGDITLSVTATTTDCDGDGVTNADEIGGIDGDPLTLGDNTDPNDPCDYNDGEQTVATSVGWNGTDCDGDGVTNADEVNGTDGDPNTAGDNTDPRDPCDFNAADITVAQNAAWNSADCDGDGVTNGSESIGGSDPLDPCDPTQTSGYNGYDASNPIWAAADCDGDGDTNGSENGFSDPYCNNSTLVTPLGTCCDTLNGALDCDGDGVTNGQEATDGTSPVDPCDNIYTNATLVATDAGDCDGDGITNADEINGIDGDPTTGSDETDPNDPCDFNISQITITASSTGDCDGDGVTNVDEINGLDGNPTTTGDNTDPRDPCDYNPTQVTIPATSTGDCDGDGVTNADEINGTDGDPTTIADNTNATDTCDFNVADQSVVTSPSWDAKDCDGDGVTNLNEINGTDGDPNTAGDNTNPLDPCSFNSGQITLPVANANDCDGDGVSNADEAGGLDGNPLTFGDNTNPNDPCEFNTSQITLPITHSLDCDGDGVPSVNEVGGVDGNPNTLGDNTDPNDPCDYNVSQISLVATSIGDCDGDGVTNADEINGTDGNPFTITDNTDAQDPCSLNYLDATVVATDGGDCDGDGVINADEVNGIDGDPLTQGDNTDPLNPCEFNGVQLSINATDGGDCDGDGVSNMDEINGLDGNALTPGDSTNPNDPCDYNSSQISLPATAITDCDGDGVTNSDEVNGPDGDPLTTGDNTDPNDPCDFNLSQITLVATSTGDCDGDGVSNADEINGSDGDPFTIGDNTDPNDPCDFNVLDISGPNAGWITADCDGDGVTNGNEIIGLDNNPLTLGDNTNPLDPCNYNAADITDTAYSTGDCDGDGVTDADEINGTDGNPLTTGDNTDAQNPCDFNTPQITLPVTSTGDCDGDGVTNQDEVNGIDGNPLTTLDNTDPQDSCDFNVSQITVVATSTGDCDGDGVINADEINGPDGDPLTTGDNTDPFDPCSLNLTQVTVVATDSTDCDNDGVNNSDEINGLDGDPLTTGDNTDPNDPCDYNISQVTVLVLDSNDCDGDGVINADEIGGLDNNPNTPGDNTDPTNPCDYNIADVSVLATSTGDCDGDGVTDADEINGVDGDPLTTGDNTDASDPCDYNAISITLPTTAAFDSADCDGDGVINIDEINGLDGDPNTTADNTDPLDTCDLNIPQVTVTQSPAWLNGDCDGDGVTNDDEVGGIDGNRATGGDNTDFTDPCDYNASQVTLVATSQGDCDGDGVTNEDEINGPDGDPNTPDGTDAKDPCSINLAQVSDTATSTGDCDGDGVTNADEINGTDGDPFTVADNTNPNDSCDFNAIDITLVPSAAWVNGDCDGDGVTNATEVNGTDGNPLTIGDNTDPTDPCDYNAVDITLTQSAAWGAEDCDGDGVINSDEVNGRDGDPNTTADNTNPDDPCEFDITQVTIPATDTTDCDGDGVTNADEINGTDGDPLTLGDNTDVNDPCDFNAGEATVVATSTGDCDGDGVTNADEVNGPDGDPTTTVDATDPTDPCDFDPTQITLATSGVWDTTDCDGDGVINLDEVNGADGISGNIDDTDPYDPCNYNPAQVTVIATSQGDCDGDGVINADEINGTDGDPTTVGDNTNAADSCDLNLEQVTVVAISQGDCDGDGVTNADEINGTDGDPGTTADNTDPNDPCDYNEDQVTIVIADHPCALDVPDGFSPNGDGVNDVLVIKGLKAYPENKLLIMNRWGNKVYEAKPYNNDWNGTNQFGISVGGKDLPEGTYFYILDTGDDSLEIFKGFIYLNR